MGRQRQQVEAVVGQGREEVAAVVAGPQQWRVLKLYVPHSSRPTVR